MGKVVVLGASPDYERFSYKAVKSLKKRNYDVVAIGTQKGEIAGVVIDTGQPIIDDVDTVAMYLNVKNQKECYDYILSLKPRRIIFNPGTHNDELAEIARKNGIEVVNSCALIMLSNDRF